MSSLQEQALPPPFDPTDLKYQVSDEFPPDKESTWPYPMEKAGWVLAHNALRGAMEQFQYCLSTVKKKSSEDNNKLQAWQVKCIKEVFAFQYEFIEEHHAFEDNILAPEFSKRFKYPDKLVDDHDGIIKQLNKVNELVKNLQPGLDTATAIHEVLNEFDKYDKAIRPHLLEEETIGLPLSRAYFDPKAFAKIMMKGQLKSPPNLVAMGCFVYFNGIGTSREFLKQEGMPFFVWYLMWRPGYKKYCSTILEKVKALMDGVEPLEKKGLFSCWP